MNVSSSTMKIERGNIMTTTEQQYKFSTMTAERFDEKDMDNFTNHFDTIWISKEPFKVQLDTKEIELHLFIEHLDMSEYTADCNTQEISIGVIPTFNSLSEEHKNDLLSQFPEEDREQYKANPTSLLYDILVYGFKITLHTETTEDLNKVDYLIKSAVAVSPCVSGLIGFDLDKMQNRIGNTGWDLLSDYCEGADLIKLAMDRYREVNKEG